MSADHTAPGRPAPSAAQTETKAAPAVVPLLARGLGWAPTVIPGSAPPARTVDLARGAGHLRAQLVRFPPGWSRPGEGSYAVDEEFVVLRGALTVSGRDYPAGRYVWLPAGCRRVASAAPDGALAVAWFHGAPRWLDRTDPEVPAYDVPLGPLSDSLPEGAGGRGVAVSLRGRRPGTVGDTLLARDPGPADHDRALLWLDGWTFEVVPAGAEPRGVGTAVVRGGRADP